MCVYKVPKNFEQRKLLHAYILFQVFMKMDDDNQKVKIKLFVLKSVAVF